jgi:hypothetical protein
MTLHELSAQAQYPVWMTERSRLTAGVRYRYNRLDFDGANPFADGDLDLHRLQIPVNFWHSFHEQWKLWAGAEPGLFTDFGHVNGDDFALTALAVGAYEFTPAWTVSFGGYYSRDLGEDQLLPVLGVIWRPNRALEPECHLSRDSGSPMRPARTGCLRLSSVRVVRVGITAMLVAMRISTWNIEVGGPPSESSAS